MSTVVVYSASPRRYSNLFVGDHRKHITDGWSVHNPGVKYQSLSYTVSLCGNITRTGTVVSGLQVPRRLLP
ncbi:MAG TPA: hypothetical protein VFX43_15045 [Chitinophagaceae bacterium]|nr:hypothetical protein [Chitinophagaceae bacterium]